MKKTAVTVYHVSPLMREHYRVWYEIIFIKVKSLYKLFHARIFSVLSCQNLITCFLTFWSTVYSGVIYIVNKRNNLVVHPISHGPVMSIVVNLLVASFPEEKTFIATTDHVYMKLWHM